MRILLSMLATVSLIGCVGGVDVPSNVDPSDPTDDGNDNGDNPAEGDLTAARALFDSNVFGILTAKCSGGACHAETATGATLTRFVATDAVRGWEVAVGYAALVGNFTPALAPVITHIKPGTHKNMTYTPDEEAKITEWLTKEVELRNGQAPTAPGQESLSAATERVLSAFAGCMTIENFNAAQMANRWGGMQAQNNQECENCHNNGGEGFIASRQANLFYGVVSTKKYFFLQYLTVDLTKGAAMAQVMINTMSFQGVAQGQAPHLEHPRFNALNNQGMTALKQFYDATMLRVNDPAKPCAPRALQNM